MFKELKSILLLLFFMLMFAVLWSLTGCTKTVGKIVEKTDTVYVSHTDSDSAGVYHSGNTFISSIQKDTLTKAVHDTVVKVVFQKDSILIRDSVYVREKGDSVLVYKERWNTRMVFSHDTLLKVVRDTVVKTRTDTLINKVTDTLFVYKFVNNAASLRNISSSHEEVVKEKRGFSLWKVLGLLLLLSGVAYVWKKS